MADDNCLSGFTSGFRFLVGSARHGMCLIRGASASATAAAPGQKGGGGGSGGGVIKGAVLVADAGVRSMKLTWSDNGARQYNVYLSSSPGQSA